MRDDWHREPFTTDDNFASLWYGCGALLSWILILIFWPFHLAYVIDRREIYFEVFTLIRLVCYILMTIVWFGYILLKFDLI